MMGSTSALCALFFAQVSRKHAAEIDPGARCAIAVSTSGSLKSIFWSAEMFEVLCVERPKNCSLSQRTSYSGSTLRWRAF